MADKKTTPRKSTKTAKTAKAPANPLLDALNALDDDAKAALFAAMNVTVAPAKGAVVDANEHDKAIRAAAGGYVANDGKVVKRLADASKALRIATDDSHGMVIGPDANDGDVLRAVRYTVYKSGRIRCDTAVLGDPASVRKVAKALITAADKLDK